MKPRTTNNRTESPVLADVRLYVGARRDCVLFRINTGVYKPIDAKPGDNRHIRSAPTGFHDCVGCQIRRIRIKVQKNVGTFNPMEMDDWFYYGQYFTVETKSATGPIRKAQEDYAAAVRSRGGWAIFARSVDEVASVLGPEPDWIDEIPDEFRLPNEL